MICPNCRYDNAAAAKFCSECGTKLRALCPRCGAELPAAARLCQECGASVATAPAAAEPTPPSSLAEQFTVFQQGLSESFRDRLLALDEGENRVVTVLFADMSDSVQRTRHLPPDEAAAVVNRLLRAMVDVLIRFEGRVDRFLGDGLLAVFGVPKAHENDPERAVLAALEIRRAARELDVEVTSGINTGEVYSGGMGSERHQEVTVMGPVVNLASRLQNQAEPGQILIGEATYRQTRGAFETERLTLRLRGLPEPVSAHAVVRPWPRAEKARGIEGLHTGLIGRDRERAVLIDAARSLAQERRGQIVTVVGEAGIGKTRLVTELKTYLAQQSIPWLEGRCVAIGRSAGFWPFIDMLRAYLGVSSEDREQEVAGALVRKLTELVPQDADDSICYLGQMLSIRLEARYQERLRHASPEQVRHQTLLRMRDFFAALARREPQVVVLEDLHWADDLSLDLLWMLMDELAGAPLMLVCVYRPEREHGCWKIDSAASSKHLERYTPLRLVPLTPAESREMVESLLAMPNLPAPTRTAILENTEGNPFFVEEVVRLLIDRGALYQENGQWKASAEIGELAVPDTVKSVIFSRMDRLEQEVKQVLQCAAVIGRVFQRRLLEYLSQQNEALEESLAQLEANELVCRERSVPEVEYAFKHALTQETAYDAILRRHRGSFHERVGEGIEALYHEQIAEYYELLAFHYGRSENTTKGIEYLVKAGQKAAGRFANREALSYYGQALELAADGDRQDEILLLRAKLHASLYHGMDAAADYERLLDRARRTSNRRQELEALLGLAWAQYLVGLDHPGTGALDGYRERSAEAYHTAEGLNDKAGMARALILTSWFPDFWPERRDEAEANVKQALALSQEVGDEELIIDSKLATFEFLLLPEAHQQAEQLREQLAARHDLARLKELHWHLWGIEHARGNFERAIEVCDRAVELAREIGVAPVQYPTWKALSLLKLGRYSDAWRSLQQEVADAAHPMGCVTKEIGTAEYLLELMACDQASECATKAAEQAKRLGRAWMLPWVQYLRIRSLALGGMLDDAALAAIMADLESMRISMPPFASVEISLAKNQPDEALRQAEAMVAKAAQYQSKPHYMESVSLKLRTLELLDRPQDILAAVDEVIAMAEEMRCQPMLWRLRALKGRALSAAGGPAAAAHEQLAAGQMIAVLASNIDDPHLRQGYLAHPLIVSTLAAAEEAGAVQTRRVP